MDTITTTLDGTRKRLAQQTTQLAQQTATATRTFLTKSRKAGDRFASDTRKAGELLVTETAAARGAFTASVSAEAKALAASLELDRYLGALPALPAVSSAAAAAPLVKRVERELMVRVDTAVRAVADRVATRVQALDALVGPQLPASVGVRTAPVAASVTSNGAVAASNGRKTSNGTTAAVTANLPPITGYDDMSAKDVVARLERMSDDRAQAVFAYESANKKRATILRAAEQRLAADA